MGKVKESAVAYSPKRKVAVIKPLPSPKATVAKVLKKLKEDVTYEDIMYEVYVLEKIARGLRNIEQGNVYTHEEVKEYLKKWLK